MDKSRHKFESIGLSAAHIKSHLTPVRISLCYAVNRRCPLKLCEHHQNLYDQFSIRRRCVKSLLGRHKFDFMGLKLLQDINKIREGAADTIQPVNNHLTDLSLPDQLHHFLKAVTVSITTGKPIIHKCYYFFIPFIQPDHRPAIFNLCLTTDTVFTFYGFSCIKNNRHFNLHAATVRRHSNQRELCAAAQIPG